MYGRSAAGISSTTATHQPPATTIASVATPICLIRRHSVVGAATTYTSANAGSTRNACSVLVRKAKPMHAPASASQRVCARADSTLVTARTTQYAPRVISSTSNASGLLNRNISAATGVTASTAPAMSPAACPEVRRTAAYSTPTAATPSSACGSRMAKEFTPNSRADSSISQSEAGGLSTVMKFEASEEPKKNAFQLFVPAWTAAE